MIKLFQHQTYLLILLVCFFFSCETETKELPKELDDLRKKEPISESFHIRYVHSEDNYTTVILNANHVVEMYDDAKKSNVYELDNGIHLIFYDTLGNIKSTLTANEAKLYQNNNFATARNNVVLTNNKTGEILETEKLNWYQNDNKVSTDKFVKITTQKDIIFGDSLDADLGLNYYKIHKIKGILAYDEE